MSTASGQRMRDGRTAVDKACSLLDALGDHGGSGLSVSELSRRTRLSKSTAFRVLGMLERNALVERVGTRYRLGVRLHELAVSAHAPQHDRLRDALMPYLAELYESTRYTVHLATLHGTDVMYLAKLYGHQSAATPSRVGRRLPAHCTAVGKMLLALDVDVSTEIPFPLPALTAHSIRDHQRLSDALDRIRQDGVAVDDQESRIGLRCVAAPVIGAHGTALAAISVSAHAGTDMRAVTARLRRVSAAASQAMPRTLPLRARTKYGDAVTDPGAPRRVAAGPHNRRRDDRSPQSTCPPALPPNAYEGPSR